MYFTWNMLEQYYRTLSRYVIDHCVRRLGIQESELTAEQVQEFCSQGVTKKQLELVRTNGFGFGFGFGILEWIV